MPLPQIIAAIDRIRSADFESYDRPDTVAWLLLALRATRSDEDLINSASNRLARFQTEDGTLSVDPRVPTAYWPTTLAAFAWNGVEGQQGRAEAAIRFLLKTSGKHWDAPAENKGHDTAIVGWSWVGATHSWVIPTAMAILAISKVGAPAALTSQAESRIKSGVEMILDRQLPDGGWNYGNTIVLNNMLKPLPEESAWGLAALARRTSKAAVAKSIDYLESERATFVAPITLSAAMLAWHGWNQPIDHDRVCEASFASQDRIGEFPIAMAAQLLAVAYGTDLFLSDDLGTSEVRA